MEIPESVKNIKPVQWAMIAGAGIGLGLLLRMRKKATGTTTATTDTPATSNDTQQYGDYSGSGQTGYYQGGALTPTVDPNASSNVDSTPVAVAPIDSPGQVGAALGTYVPPPMSTPVANVPHPAVLPTPVAAPAPAPAARPVASQAMYFGMLANPAALNAYLLNGGQIAGPNDQGLSSLAQIKADLQARVNSGQLPSSVLVGL